MKTIWKFPLAVTDSQIIIRASSDAVFLSAQMQHETLCAWAIVDDRQTNYRNYLVRIVGTGHPLDDVWFTEGKFLGTVQQFDGSLVWHVFVK
jgi:hypothetical protein